MHQEIIDSFNEFAESSMKLSECIKNEIIDSVERFADALNEIAEIIKETTKKVKKTSKRQQYIECYKTPIKDYLIIFEILKIPIIKIEYQKKRKLNIFDD